MGFAAGLGEGFSTAFNNGIQAQRQAQEDDFRAAYQSFLQQQETWNKQKTDDEKLQEVAKSLVPPNAPQGAWVTAYKWLKGGMSSNDIINRLSQSTFADFTNPQSSLNNSPAQGNPTAPQGPLANPITTNFNNPSPGSAPSPAQSPVDQQMQSMGLGQQPAQSDAQPNVPFPQAGTDTVNQANQQQGGENSIPTNGTGVPSTTGSATPMPQTPQLPPTGSPSQANLTGNNVPQPPPSSNLPMAQGERPLPAPGQIMQGNINLSQRPIVFNPDGSYSMNYAMTIEVPSQDGQTMWAVVPGVGPDQNGHYHQINDAQAEEQFNNTGQHFGVFATQQDADNYAEQLHNQQAQVYDPIVQQIQNEGLVDQNGNSVPQQQQIPQAASAQQGRVDTSLGARFQNMFNPDYRRRLQMQRTQDRLSQVTGLSPDQISQIEGGYQSPAMPQAPQMTSIGSPDLPKNGTAFPGMEEFAPYGIVPGKSTGVLKANMAVTDSVMNQFAQTGTPQEKALAAKWQQVKPQLLDAINNLAPNPNDVVKTATLLTNATPEYKAISEQATQAAAMVHSAYRMAQIVKEDPAVTTFAGAAVTQIQNWKNEAQTAISLANGTLSNYFKNNPNASPDDAINMINNDSGLNKTINELFPNSKLASDYKKFRAEAIRYAYAAGRLAGQSGQSYSDKDFTNQMNAAILQNDPPAFMDNLRSQTSRYVENVNTQLHNTENIPAVAYALKDKDTAPYFQKFHDWEKQSLSGDEINWLNNNTDANTTLNSAPMSQGSQSQQQGVPQNAKSVTVGPQFVGRGNPPIPQSLLGQPIKIWSGSDGQVHWSQ